LNRSNLLEVAFGHVLDSAEGSLALFEALGAHGVNGLIGVEVLGELGEGERISRPGVKAEQGRPRPLGP
jgi:hypothetical protein